MPDAIYLALKVPGNFLLNVFGLGVWTEISTIGEPFVKWDVPAAMRRFTADKQIGLCFDWRLPIKTLIVFLSVFGVGPFLLSRFRKRWRVIFEAPLAIQIAGIYGLVCYLVGPALGNWVERLIGYGWPAFWIALPWLLRNRYAPLSRQEAGVLAAAFMIVAWWPTLFGWTPQTNFALCAAGLLVLYVPVVLWLKKVERRHGWEAKVAD